MGRGSSSYGLSPVEARVLSKTLALLLDHGSISNSNGCCCKTNSIWERLLHYFSDTTLGLTKNFNALSFVLRTLAAPPAPETNATRLDLFIIRIIKRIASATIDDISCAKNNQSMPSTAALVSEINELLIWMQKNSGFPIRRILLSFLGVVSGRSAISAPGALKPEDWSNITQLSDFMSSFRGPRLSCLGPCGNYNLGVIDELAPFYKTIICERLVPDPCLDRLCSRIKQLMIQLFDLAPANKCKLRAFKYRDCCGNVRTLCAVDSPDFVTIFLQTLLSPNPVFNINGVSTPVDLLGNKLLLFLIGLIKRFVCYTPPPRIGAIFKGPCHAADIDCNTDPLSLASKNGCTDCSAAFGDSSNNPFGKSTIGQGVNSGDASGTSCAHDPFDIFGSFGFWNAGRRRQFEEEQTENLKEKETPRASFEHVAAMLKESILASQKQHNSSSNKETEEKDQLQEEGQEDSARTRKPLPSRDGASPKNRIHQNLPLPQADRSLNPPKSFTLDDLPKETNMASLNKVGIF